MASMEFDWLGGDPTPTEPTTLPTVPQRPRIEYGDEFLILDEPDVLTQQERQFLYKYVQGVPPVQAHMEVFPGNMSKSARGSAVRDILAMEEAIALVERANSKLEELAVASRLEVEAYLTTVLRAPDPLPGCPGREKLKAIEILNKMRGYDAPTRINLETSGGVLEVPLADSLAEWEQAAAGSQKALMADTIDI